MDLSRLLAWICDVTGFKRRQFDALQARFVRVLVGCVIGLRDVRKMERQGLFPGDGGGVGHGGRGGGGGGGRGAIGTSIIECGRAEDDIGRYGDKGLLSSRIAGVFPIQKILWWRTRSFYRGIAVHAYNLTPKLSTVNFVAYLATHAQN